ncbi:MAG: hypothetical protein JWQ94_3909 [Tardiphaga sp.]|nr:hypothetical protein [Tardiphaga sp.]
MRNLIRRFRSDQRGNIAIMAAGGMVLAVCCAALGVDIGSISADRRKTQSTADISAIVAATNIGNAVNAATAAVTQNNYPASALLSVELGTYTANAALAPAARFVTPAVGLANAARVKLRTQTPLYFSHFFTGSSNFQINSSAIAKTSQMASFAIGSRLASVNNGLLNGLLGGMLGTTLSLSVMDYNALLGAKIDALTFLNALATRVNLTGVSYSTLLSTNIKVSDILAAALTTQKATNGAGAATTALSSVVTAVTSLPTKILPGALFDLGPYASGVVGQASQLAIGLSLYDLMKATAGVANGINQVASNVNLGITGIASASVITAVGAQPTGTSWITVGSQGASVYTAQTRILATIALVGTPPASVVTLKTYVEVASGTATLTNISCGYPNINTSTVTLGVTPGIIDAWIGDVSTADLNNFAAKPSPPALKIVDLGLVSVSARAHAAMGNTTPVPVTFSYADITAQTKKTVSSTNFTSSLTSSLLNDLVVAVNVIGLGIPIPGLGSLVTGIIGGATAGIDQLLSTVLASLGVGIGQADVWVTGVRCNGAVLVN